MIMHAMTRTGITKTTIHAPWVNLLTAITRATAPVTVAPMPLTARRRCHPGPRCASQWRTMPACDSVNEMKTPTA
ncbi:MAG: hypothetical protein A3I03_05745 [Candidatus Rokubacteria bacterium RIFCSPLOWO2_02_FULL_68_19]|nr:MAG: hypothetical protein A3I03_05745 [Candidatus Rokubacteria bacterium RIFCSPLOWO2_02_FULL_68_19]